MDFKETTNLEEFDNKNRIIERVSYTYQCDRLKERLTETFKYYLFGLITIKHKQLDLEIVCDWCNNFGNETKIEISAELWTLLIMFVLILGYWLV